MGCDWDEVLAYTTGKTVTVQHRWLGFVYYLLLFLILAYIGGWQIGVQQSYNLNLDVNGIVRANVEGAGADKLRPEDELGYCNKPYFDGHTYPCIYPELATGLFAKEGLGKEGSLYIATRLSAVTQLKNVNCTDMYRCPNWLPEPGTGAPYDDAKITSFIGDIESATVRLQHRVSIDTERAFGYFKERHFLNTFSPKALREKANPQMCLETDQKTCVDPHAILSSGDVFNVSQFLQLADIDLDAYQPDINSTYRLGGRTIKVRVGYSSPNHYDYFLATTELEFRDVFVDPSSAGTNSRMLYDVHGLQLLLSHEGTLGRASAMQGLLVFITGLGLFTFAKTITDYLLMYGCPKREAYSLFVRDLTPDFSPDNDQEKAVLDQVLHAKRSERIFIQGKAPFENAHTSMLAAQDGQTPNIGLARVRVSPTGDVAPAGVPPIVPIAPGANQQ